MHITLSGEDVFDSIVGTIDVNESTNVLASMQRNLVTPNLKSFRRKQLMQFLTKKLFGYPANTAQ